MIDRIDRDSQRRLELKLRLTSAEYNAKDCHSDTLPYSGSTGALPNGDGISPNRPIYARLPEVRSNAVWPMLCHVSELEPCHHDQAHNKGETHQLNEATIRCYCRRRYEYVRNTALLTRSLLVVYLINMPAKISNKPEKSLEGIRAFMYSFRGFTLSWSHQLGRYATRI